jgi:hypothetical protein
MILACAPSCDPRQGLRRCRTQRMDGVFGTHSVVARRQAQPAWTRITPQVCLKRKVMVHLNGATVVRRRDLLTRRQRTRSLTRTCQGSQHRPAASADNTIARVHQVSRRPKVLAACW